MLGRGLVKAMPVVMSGLASVGTAAMLWVGGGIVVHGLHEFHVPVIPGLVEGFSHLAGTIPVIGAITGWIAMAAASALVGAVVGGAVVAVLHVVAHGKRH